MKIIRERLERVELWDSTVERELKSLWKYGVLRISNQLIRQGIVDFLEKEAPLGFFVNPASVSGKHHPTWQNEKCGILRNTTECCLLVDIMLEQYKEFCDAINNVLPDSRDIVLSATILSDTFKYGTAIVKPYSDSEKHLKDHGKEAANRWIPTAYGLHPKDHTIDLVEEIFETTYWHLGRWTPGWTPEVKLSKLTEIVHILDAIFADKNLELLYEPKHAIE